MAVSHMTRKCESRPPDYRLEGGTAKALDQEARGNPPLPTPNPMVGDEHRRCSFDHKWVVASGQMKVSQPGCVGRQKPVPRSKARVI